MTSKLAGIWQWKMLAHDKGLIGNMQTGSLQPCFLALGTPASFIPAMGGAPEHMATTCPHSSHSLQCLDPFLLGWSASSFKVMSEFPFCRIIYTEASPGNLPLCSVSFSRWIILVSSEGYLLGWLGVPWSSRIVTGA